MSRIRNLVVEHGFFGLILLLSLFPRFYQLGQGGFGCPSSSGNVRSMLHSWWHFFFVAWDPAGTYMFDKPPLGFWLQTLSAFILGYHGFALMLPQAVAGMITLILAYYLIVKLDGRKSIALAATAILAFHPAVVLVARSNKVDPHLTMLTLATACLLVTFADTRKARWLWLAAVCAGLAFNVKGFAFAIMLPSIGLLGLWSQPWRPPMSWLKLCGPLALYLVLTFGWIAAVDLTPEDKRPRVMNTDGNRITELTLIHNGLSRMSTTAGFDPAQFMTSRGPGIAIGSLYGGPRGFARIRGEFPGTMLRYLLPMVLAGIVLSITSIQQPRRLIGTLFWLLWLLLGWTAFSVSRLGSPHYLELFMVPYAVMAGTSLAFMVDASRWRSFIAIAAFITSSAWVLTGFHAFHLVGSWIGFMALLCILAALYHLLNHHFGHTTRRLLVRCAIAVFILIPLVISAVSVRENPTEGVIPGAIFLELKRRGEGHPSSSSRTNPYITASVEGARPILDYAALQEPDIKYLAAVPSMSECSVVVTHYNRACIPYHNEFVRRTEHSAAQLATLIYNGELRFVLVPRRQLATLNANMKALLQHGEEISGLVGLPDGYPILVYDMVNKRTGDASE